MTILPVALILCCAKPDVAPPMTVDERRHAALSEGTFHGVAIDWSNTIHVSMVIRMAGLLREDWRHHCSIGEEDVARTALRDLRALCRRAPLEALRRDEVCADVEELSCD